MNVFRLIWDMRRPKDLDAVTIRPRLGGRRVPLIILRPKKLPAPGPGLLWIHGGGYFLGMKEMVYSSVAAELVRTYGITVISPGYRLALHKPYPAALEDCYRALIYMRDNAAALNIAPDKLMAGGVSAGGGLCAALCMLARDRGEVNISFQMPLYPMLDNFDTTSSRDNHGKVWNTRRNHFGWRVYLRRDAKKAVSPYASPARQTDYSGLPPCYTFVGDGEPFYCETLEYVENLRKAGISADADVYHTDVHAFDLMRKDEEPALEAKRVFSERFGKAAGLSRGCTADSDASSTPGQ